MACTFSLSSSQSIELIGSLVINQRGRRRLFWRLRFGGVVNIVILTRWQRWCTGLQRIAAPAAPASRYGRGLAGARARGFRVVGVRFPGSRLRCFAGHPRDFREKPARIFACAQGSAV